ncbi:uncharacterized protein DUF4325 [Luteibacter sp. OK325]|uniref:STAS-like domain-containing protein n=1 Tax=Luteibacter sp. OK325 TaxID=2135670 RepID=UPI000D3CF0E0|nr:STAS-like domain-containing protein [Luteibacter sp. OK325]PTR30759.1 uncharacterized protein DUF4325 [Luteibacter sp. OK325]
MRIPVAEIAGRNAVSSKAGEAVYKAIIGSIDVETVELDFIGVEIFSTPFFNLAIGRLLERMSADMLNQRLQVVNLTPLGFSTLRRVIDNAKRHYSGLAT